MSQRVPISQCVSCKMPLPLLRPLPADTASGWECVFCGEQYRAVLDETQIELRNNVRLVSGPYPPDVEG